MGRVQVSPESVKGRVRHLPFLSKAVNSTLIKEGDVLDIKENVNTKGGGFFADVVKASEIAIDNIDYIACAGKPLLAIAVRKDVARVAHIERTWYVDPINGVDDLMHGYASGASAFKTIQFAYDSLPSFITKSQVIQLADGNYFTSSIPNSEQPRAAVLWARGKLTSFRSALSGDDVAGPIVIKGNPTDNTAVKIQTSSSYTYGIYNNGGQLALQDLTVETTGNNGGVLIVSHRNTSHVYCKNVIADSIYPLRTTACVDTESGGQLEWIDGKIKNSKIGAFAQGSGENMTFATRAESIFEGNNTAIIAKNNNFVQLVSLRDGVGKVQIIDSSNTVGILAINGTHISVRGNDGTTDMCQIGAGINLDNATMDLVFSETLNYVLIENGSGIKYNASNYKKGINAAASDVWLATSNSYVSPAVVNDDVRPITLTDGARINYDGINNIVGSEGGYVSYNTGALAYTADNETIATVIGRGTYRITSSSGNKANAQIDATDIEEGRVISCYGSVNSVTFVDGEHMDLGASIVIGQSTGNYSGMTLLMDEGKWRVIALGVLRT